MNRDEEEATEKEKARRHAEVYATPGLPPFSYFRIDERLWHGRNPLTAKDVEELRERGITHILDLREPKEYEETGRFGRDALHVLDTCGIVRRHIPVPDGGAPGPEALEDACAFLTETLANPEARVYVHCRMGRERTGAVLVAFHSCATGLGYDDALQALQEKGAQIQPLPPQERTVRAWLEGRR